MKIDFFSAKKYDIAFFDDANKTTGFDIFYHETHLGPHSVNIIEDASAVCVFVNDKLTREVIKILAKKGIKIIALRCAGFNNVDLDAAKEFNISVCRVPSYSPEAVAEHAVAMLMTINRKTHKAYNRVREQNFSLDGLLGYNLFGKTVGVIGTGKIGKAFINIMLGFGCKILAFDISPDLELQEKNINYVALEKLFQESNIISLHCPLTKENHYLINKVSINLMQTGITLVNTSRGGLLNTADVIEALKSKKINALCIDVYEQEEHLFFKDLSLEIINDDKIQRLISFPNVLLTAHQAFFTKEALEEIAETTMDNIARLDKNTMPKDAPTMLSF
jgi:D-lactate dehydrogenase